MADQETIRPRHGELLTAHEAFELVYRLRQHLDREVYFAQVLIRYLTWEDLCVLESLMGLSGELASTPPSDNERAQHRYLVAVNRSIMRAPRVRVLAMEPTEKVERLNRIRASKKLADHGNERKW